MGHDWNPDQYSAFSNYRQRPALDLIQRIPLDCPSRIIDLGCGTGDVTLLLRQRWPQADLIGLDSSPRMLEKARERSNDICWQLADALSWRADNACDLIFSNAMLHWVDDHENVLRQLLAQLDVGGCLAVQMPLSWKMPSHQLMRQTLADCGSRGIPLGGEALYARLEQNPVADPRDYLHWLSGDGREVDIWSTTYLQLLEGEDAVLRWVEATGLRPVLRTLTAEQLDRFLPLYRERLRAAYPRQPDGKTVYPFERLFMVARRI